CRRRRASRVRGYTIFTPGGRSISSTSYPSGASIKMNRLPDDVVVGPSVTRMLFCSSLRWCRRGSRPERQGARDLPEPSPDRSEENYTARLTPRCSARARTRDESHEGTFSAPAPPSPTRRYKRRRSDPYRSHACECGEAF